MLGPHHLAACCSPARKCSQHWAVIHLSYHLTQLLAECSQSTVVGETKQARPLLNIKHVLNGAAVGLAHTHSHIYSFKQTPASAFCTSSVGILRGHRNLLWLNPQAVAACIHCVGNRWWRCLIHVETSMCRGCKLLNHCKLYDDSINVLWFNLQQASGDSKAKGDNTPHGNVAQQCSVCARVCTVFVAQFNSGSRRDQTCGGAYSLLWLFLLGRGAGTAGFTLPEFWTFAVNRKCSGNGCNTDLCRFTSWFGLLWHPPALCGQGKKDWYHLPSCFPHELPYVQRPLLAYLQGSTTWRPSSCTVTAPSTGTVKTLDTFNPALFTETFTGWESSVEQDAVSRHAQCQLMTRKNSLVHGNFSTSKEMCFWLALLLHALHINVRTLACISRISTHAFWRDFCICSFCRLTCVILQHVHKFYFILH